MKIDDILVYTWGYDQTNANFYQVVGISKSGKSVIIRTINQKYHENSLSAMVGKTIPIPHSFCDRPAMTKRIKQYDGREILNMEHGIAHKWDGLPVSYSNYA